MRDFSAEHPEKIAPAQFLSAAHEMTCTPQ
jgi:hypothetical protein